MAHGGSISQILNISRNYFALEAADANRQQVRRFMRFRRTDRSVGECVVEIELLCGEAGFKKDMGADSLCNSYRFRV